jgi:hypothetical protein
MPEIKKIYSLVIDPKVIKQLRVMSDTMSKPKAKVSVSEILRRGADVMLADFEDGKFE